MPESEAKLADDGYAYCNDGVACKFWARRRLGVPLDVCREFRAREEAEERERSESEEEE
jgi:hypothetical protein